MKDFDTLLEQIDVNAEIKEKIDDFLSKNEHIPRECFYRGLIFSAAEMMFDEMPTTLAAYRQIFRSLRSAESHYRLDKGFPATEDDTTRFERESTKIELMCKRMAV